MENTDFDTTNVIFLEIEDLLTLVIQNSTINSREEVFIDIFYWIYEKKGVTPAIKDALYDRTRRRKPFNHELRSLATTCEITYIYNYIYKKMGNQLRNSSRFAKKLYYLIQKDNFSFSNTSDLQLEQIDDCIYLLAYIAQKLIIFSDVWTKQKHSEDYNPFINYREEDNELISPNPGIVDVALKKLSSAHYSHFFKEENYDIEFRSELLTQGMPYVIDKSFRFFTSNSSLDPHDNSEQSIDEIIASSSKSILLIGEGGIGKTTFLLSHLKKLNAAGTNTIPLYVKLSDCSSNNDHRRIIINSLIEQMNFYISGNNMPSYCDVIDSFNSSSSKYILLLDGFNEITALDSGEIRYSIANEINELLKLKNVQIILSSREVDFYGLSLNEFVVVKATGISDEIIKKYISTIYSPEIRIKIYATSELMDLLHNPLFLLMFTHTVHPDTTAQLLPRNRGSVLFQYFNSTSSFYTEMNKDSNPNNLLTNSIITFLLDFIVPDLGYYMESNDIFSISEEVFDDIFYNCQNDTKNKIKYCPPAIKNHYNRPYDLHRIFLEVQKLVSSDIILLICDGLNILTKDNEGKLYFCHQYIRDYFSAYYFIRECSTLNNIFITDPKTLLSAEITWGNSLWDDEKNNLVYEIIDFDNKIFSANDLVNTLALFKQNRRFHLTPQKYEITNIIEILALLNKADLSFLDMSHLDLSAVNITGKNFYNSSLNRTANFTNAIIGHDTCMIEGHLSDVNKWSVSADERFILSVSNTREIKVWNLATQTCIYTRENIPFCDYSLPYNAIAFCDLYKNGTLALFLLYDANKDSHRAFSYDFLTNQFTEYTPLEGNCDIQLFTYIAKSDSIVAVTKSHYIEFTCNVISPIASTKHSEAFAALMDIKRYYSTYALHICNAYKLYYLDEEHILFCFTDNNAPALADTFEEDYDKAHQIDGEELDYNYYERRDLYHDQYLSIRNTERHTNYYIYNISTQNLNLLHLDCDEDSEFSLYFYERTHLDAIEAFTAVSKDGRFIVLHNSQDIFRYDMYTDEDFLFKKVCVLPHGYHPYNMKFCHQNYSNYLSLYDHDHVLHLDILSGELLLDKEYSTSAMGGSVMMTENYLLETDPLGYNTNFTITNIYSGNSTSFSLSSFGQILSFITSSDGQTLQVLYDNGSIFTYALPNLELVNSYNFAYKQVISSYAYDNMGTIYCTCNQKHDYMYNNRQSIIKIKIEEHQKPLESARIFSGIKKLYLCPNSNYLLAFTDIELLLLDKETLQLLSRCDLRDDTRYQSLVDVVYSTETNKVYALYPDDHKNYYETFGKMLPIKIHNNIVSIGPATFIPIYEPDDTCPPLLIKQISYSVLCFIKVLDEDYDDFVKYYYESPAEQDVFSEEMKCSYRDLTDWCLVYLQAHNQRNEMFYEEKYLELRDSDSLILNDFLTSPLLIEKGGHGYEWNIENDSLSEISFANISDLETLCYDASNHIIFCTMNKARDIHSIYTQNKQYSDTRKPVPELLVFNCDFSNCQLANDVKINMLAASGAILHSK